MKYNRLLNLPKENREKKSGIYSVCSSNEFVIRAACRDAVEYGYPVLVESTANQVNQEGGYTGMTPTEFVRYVRNIALEEGLTSDNLIIGGDHLGPLTWTDLDEKEAMRKAEELISSYVLAGYTKIHIDTSMKVADDPSGPLDTFVSARRGARLAKVVDDSYRKYRVTHPDSVYPVLVVGSEVPVPGGSQEIENKLVPTGKEDFIKQYKAFKKAFEEENLSFENVIGFVVQPGVEFGDSFVFQYDRNSASELTSSLRDYDNIVFEGHSTDYQTNLSLRKMVEDGIGILKVGPEFTFRLREALILVSLIDEELNGTQKNYRTALLSAMDSNPKYWKKYYRGSEREIAYKKLYSYSDRARYYLPQKEVSDAIKDMIERVDSIPDGLMSQFFPLQYKRYMDGMIKSDVTSIIIDYVQSACHDYAVATSLCV